ncbi:putative SNF2 family N-terminal domain containing protein [Klebsormidium nitens]|uniref:Putative SNF2 family N-terminal domain containing protein n=1 Tax=Klebsormidium nitens TaxID=105231 RepID=A0A1Y1IPH3_KLENI|nr:putative SNF2 family N-terminal domain containing protein [Klebsormidium nitens]|eukprot:GAQ90018.1 putative SNF2 family N-terminal domain containing protein [Klebsormidium nitens]
MDSALKRWRLLLGLQGRGKNSEVAGDHRHSMAEANAAELANFLWTIKGQFQEDPAGLAVKLARICESLRNSGLQENQQTYNIVASALRTVVVVGRLDPYAIPGGSSMRSLTEDGPVFIPEFVQSEGLRQPASRPLPVTLGTPSPSSYGNHELLLPREPPPYQPPQQSPRFSNWQAAPPVQAASPYASSAANQPSQTPGQPGRSFSGSPAHPQFAPPGLGASVTRPISLSRDPIPRPSPTLQAREAALQSQQAFLLNQSSRPVPKSPGPPNHSVPVKQALNNSRSASPQRKGSFQQPPSQVPGLSTHRDPPRSSPALFNIPPTSHGSPINSGIPISPHELPSSSAFAEKAEPRGSTTDRGAPPSPLFSPPLQPARAPAVVVSVSPHGSNHLKRGPDPGYHFEGPYRSPPKAPGRSGLQQNSGQPGRQAPAKRQANKSPARSQPVSSKPQLPVDSTPPPVTTTPSDAVAETVRVCVHKRAQTVLASGGNTNPELLRVAETVKQLSKAGSVPECFLPEQKRQLIAQIQIFQNVRHGKPSSQATVALALEDLKDLLPKLSTLQRADTKGPGEAAKAPGRGVKQPLTGVEKKEKQGKKGRERKKTEKPLKQPGGPAKKSAAAGGQAPQQHQNAASNRPGIQAIRKPSPPIGALSRPGGFQNPPQTSRKSLPQQARPASEPLQQSKAPKMPQTLVPPEPPDTRKPQFMTAWLSQEKRKSDAESAKWSQLQTKLVQHVAVKTAEVKRAEAVPSQDDCKTKKVIDLKKLELLALQQKLRKEVMDGFFAPAQAELQNVRQVKLQRSLRRIREAERKEQKLRDERARREKEKVKNFAKTLDQHKALLADLQRAKKERVLRNNRAVTEFHKRKERAEREKKERLQREKIQALKSNDVEGYMKLVQDAKSDRVQQLLKETESYLHKLGEKLAAVTMQAREAEVGEGVVAAEQELVKTTDEAAASILESNEKYYTLAHAVKEAVIEQPKMLVGGQLREYQMKGLQWMVSLHNNRLNGILADEMGLGKTIQVIGLLCFLMETKKVSGPFLIVVPSSVFSNWVSEIKRWAPSAITVAYRGNPETRRRIYSEQVAAKKFNILVTTYEFLMNKHDRPRLSKIRWAHLIIDEGHRIKNANCKLNTDLKQYSARNRLLLTGTPIQNNLDELWTLLNFLLPDIFNSSDDFRQWFNKPFEGSGVEETEDQALLNEEENLLVINRLHQVLRPFMLRRMKEKVADELPGKVERLIRCEASAYQKLLARQVTEKLGRLPGQSKGKAVQNTVMELRNICNHPYLSLLHVEDVEYSLEDDFLPTAVRLCGKLEMLDRILPKLKVGGHKVLFFCTMTRLLDVMEDYLVQKGYGYLRLDGSTGGADRGTLIEQFNAPDSSDFIFLLSLRAGGIGINLQAADTVIIYDTDWNPQVDLQAQARAHRIGQKRDVLVLRMETVNTVEEKIRARAEHKMGVATQSITAGFFDQSTSAEDRRDFLEAILREANSDRQESSEVPDDDQLNEMLARTPEEVELFAAEDRKRQREDQARWRASKGSAEMPGVLPRLVTDAELEPVLKELERANAEQSRSGSVGASEDLGRGRRSQGVKRQGYADLTERQFNYLLREGSLPPSAFKKRARSEDKQDSGVKKQKKDGKPSEEASSWGPEPTVARKGEVAIVLERQSEQPLAERHVPSGDVAGELPSAAAASLENGGRVEVRRGPDGAAALPRAEAQVVPGVGLQRAVTAQPESSAKAPGESAPSSLAAGGPTAVDDSDEDLPLCALRAPAPKKARHVGVIRPLQKPGPSPQPFGHVSTMPCPATGAQSGGPQKQFPGLAPEEDASRGRNGEAPVNIDLADSAAYPRRVSEAVTETSPVTGTGALRITLPDSELGRNGQVTGTLRPKSSSPGGMVTGIAASSEDRHAVLHGSSGVPAESGPAGKLQPLQGTESPPRPVAALQAAPGFEASELVARNKPSTPHSAAAAPPVGTLDSGGARLEGANKPRVPIGGSGAGDPSAELDGTGSKSRDRAESVEAQPHADATQPHAQTTRAGGTVGDGVAAKGSAAVRSEVPRKGFKRRRTLCQTAEEAFEWSEEDVEEPSPDGRRPLDGRSVPGSVISASGTPVRASPPIANGEKAGILSGREKGNGDWSRNDLAGRAVSQVLSPSFASRPEVLRVSAAAQGGLDGGEPWKEALPETVPSGNGIKVGVHGNPARSTSHWEASSRAVTGTAPGFPGSVPYVRGPSRQGSPALSSPSSARNAGALASPTACNGRGGSQSPRLRVGERNERATPDSVVSEASLRAAHSAVGSLLDSMEVDGEVPCKKWLY